jgi:DGQHR domain-containing protein
MNSNMDGYKGIPCIPANQPIGDMYVCVLDSAFLQKITYADVRRNESECRNVERYVGVQRVLDPKREKEIGKYVNFVDATFPNSIIVNVSSDDANYDEKNKVLFIKDEESVASVLDGQHRIAGLKHLKDGSTFDCIVTVFIDLELEDQAIIFSTINTEQKKINKSLAADLAEFYNSRSPQRTCHNIARALRANEKSPFYGKISILGSAKKDEGESLTQYQFVKELLKHITKSPLEDRDVLKRKDFWGNKQKLTCTDKEKSSLCLRPLFVEDESDVKIAQVILNYFNAVKKRWPKSWDTVENNNILNKTTGFIALMKFLKAAYLTIDKEIPSIDDFFNIFKKTRLEDGQFSRDNFPSGGSGENELYKRFKESVSI